MICVTCLRQNKKGIWLILALTKTRIRYSNTASSANWPHKVNFGKIRDHDQNRKKPWNPVHVDFAGLINGATYLVFVDSRSKSPAVTTMVSTSASATICVLDNIFRSHRLSESVVAHNGTQFTSVQFR